MTAATGRVAGVKPFSDDDAIPWALPYSLGAGVGPSRNWLMGINPAGYAVAQAAGVTGLVSAGFSDRDDVAASAAGAAVFLARQQFVSGFPNSTATLDAILASDVSTPCFAVDNQTVGKLSNYGGTNRSLLGLAFGVDVDNATPIVWVGPVAWQLARAALVSDAADGGSYKKAIDAGAGTDLGEDVCNRPRLHGSVAKVEFVVAGATLGASGGTDYKTITVSKRDGAGGSPVVIATANTKTTAFTQWTAVDFTLSAVAGALDLLETDIVTIQESHGGSGAIIPAGNLRVSLKVG